MSLSGFQRRRREQAAKEAAEREAVEKEENKTIDEMSTAELKKYAADNGIDLGEAKGKSAILAAIKSYNVSNQEPDTKGDGA